ncbi:argininosuccinate lyase [Sporosarcina pasteurii]|uniref:Argininosuccinate lyase n=2 Tax=Sporosarcina pasteurii TaxID=1474 RepID=A0A380CBH3_SPOPA|nr:argininosuccinate lyase [Sporosarcina pasteurii]MDS9473121.1 argininosuccinate lyase [Sporosarcina pasteurii]QBQ04230.1 argininosuccinate lyase [Sporosarcina pasteurii]SUJ17251.1 Argininosuccinate lyase [Sporosarcina pasteurii]
MKLWGGRFTGREDNIMKKFNTSLPVDRRLYFEDITGSIAHVKMLVACELLTEDEGTLLVDGLESILKDIESGVLKVEGDFEDIHSFVEMNLTERIGEVGKKLHTARSRNDQVAVDMRQYAKNKGQEVMVALQQLIDSLNKKAAENNVIMPGYTHLQRAQVVTFNHHLGAYVQMFSRDKKRIENAVNILDENPLGCGALAGTTHNIDRQITTDLLGFSKPVDNFLDGVSDRDYLLELMSGFSITMMHMSRLSEELILWSSQEFKFIEMDDAYATGSSIMPQKKNPDAAELIRGKTGRVYGSLFALLTTLKGLPLTYNKDMQEDKEQFFDALDTVLDCLEIMAKMIDTLHVQEENMKAAIKAGFLNATEVADYLVSKGTAFRDAHEIVGKIIIYCEEQEKAIEDLTIAELAKFSDHIAEDIYAYIDYDAILEKGNKKLIKKTK